MARKIKRRGKSVRKPCRSCGFLCYRPNAERTEDVICIVCWRKERGERKP